MSVTGVPWDPQATKLDEVPLPRIVEGDHQPPAPPVQEEKSKKALRRLCITKLLDAQRVMPPELAREALEFNTLQGAERGWSVCFSQKRAICV